MEYSWLEKRFTKAGRNLFTESRQGNLVENRIYGERFCREERTRKKYHIKYSHIGGVVALIWRFLSSEPGHLSPVR